MGEVCRGRKRNTFSNEFNESKLKYASWFNVLRLKNRFQQISVKLLNEWKEIKKNKDEVKWVNWSIIVLPWMFDKSLRFSMGWKLIAGVVVVWTNYIFSAFSVTFARLRSPFTTVGRQKIEIVLEIVCCVPHVRYTVEPLVYERTLRIRQVTRPSGNAVQLCHLWLPMGLLVVLKPHQHKNLSVLDNTQFPRSYT